MDPVVIKRIFPCNRRRLFDAWSKPAQISAWFFASQQPLKNSTVENAFTVGGHYSVTMHLGTGEYTMRGEYIEINRYHRISFTWNSHLVEHTLVELDFLELSPNRTQMTLTHSRFTDEEVRGRHVEGWERCLGNLQRFLAQPLQ